MKKFLCLAAPLFSIGSALLFSQTLCAHNGTHPSADRMPPNEERRSRGASLGEAYANSGYASMNASATSTPLHQETSTAAIPSISSLYINNAIDATNNTVISGCNYGLRDSSGEIQITLGSSLPETAIKIMGNPKFPSDFAISLVLEPGNYPTGQKIYCIRQDFNIPISGEYSLEEQNMKLRLYIENKNLMLQRIVSGESAMNNPQKKKTNLVLKTSQGFTSPRSSVRRNERLNANSPYPTSPTKRNMKSPIIQQGKSFH